MSSFLSTRSLSEITQVADAFTALSNKMGALVCPDNPPKGIAGYIFDIVEEDKVELTSDITSHVLEDKSFAHDHITLKPETVTVSGLVGELRDTPLKPLADVGRFIRALDPVAAYVPRVASNVNRIYNDAERLARETDKVLEQFGAPSLYDLYKMSLNTAVSAWEKMKEIIKAQGKTPAETPAESPSESPAVAPANQAEEEEYNYGKFKDEAGKWKNRQMEAYEFFFILWRNKEFVTVQTPWGIWPNMAIESMTALQNNTTSGLSGHLSSFKIVFKQIRVIDENDATKTVSSSGRAAEKKGLGNVLSMGSITGLAVSVALAAGTAVLVTGAKRQKKNPPTEAPLGDEITNTEENED